MVSNIGRQYRPRTGLQAPLRERWEAARSRLTRIAPDYHPARSALLLQMGEYEIDCIEDEIAKLERERNQATAPDPAIQAASAELSALKQRYHTAWLKLQEAQKKLRWTAQSWRHQLLADVPDKFVMPQQISPTTGTDDFHSVAEARMAVKNFLPVVLAIEDTLSQAEGALAFDNQPLDCQCRDLIEALFKRVAALEAQRAIPQQRRIRQ
jgi:hypothetical protein